MIALSRLLPSLSRTRELFLDVLLELFQKLLQVCDKNMDVNDNVKSATSLRPSSTTPTTSEGSSFNMLLSVSIESFMELLNLDGVTRYDELSQLECSQSQQIELPSPTLLMNRVRQKAVTELFNKLWEIAIG